MNNPWFLLGVAIFFVLAYWVIRRQKAKPVASPQRAGVSTQPSGSQSRRSFWSDDDDGPDINMEWLDDVPSTRSSRRDDDDASAPPPAQVHHLTTNRHRDDYPPGRSHDEGSNDTSDSGDSGGDD